MFSRGATVFRSLHFLRGSERLVRVSLPFPFRFSWFRSTLGGCGHGLCPWSGRGRSTYVWVYCLLYIWFDLGVKAKKKGSIFFRRGRNRGRGNLSFWNHHYHLSRKGSFRVSFYFSVFPLFFLLFVKQGWLLFFWKYKKGFAKGPRKSFKQRGFFFLFFFIETLIIYCFEGASCWGPDHFGEGKRSPFTWLFWHFLGFATLISLFFGF